MWHQGIITRIEDLSSTTKRFFMEVPAWERATFRPGQFVTMDLPIHEKRLKRWRSYSIANAPNDSNVLEFCIVRMDEGLASTYLFEKVEVGTPITFKGPDGMFTLPASIEQDLVFICTGTGIAPFRAMLQHIQRNQLPHRSLHLIYGTRYAENMLYKEEWEALQRTLPGFKYSVALSRESGVEGVFQGHVHQVYESEYAARTSGVKFYLCGWQKMVDEARGRLEKMGVAAQDIAYELYG